MQRSHGQTGTNSSTGAPEREAIRLDGVEKSYGMASDRTITALSGLTMRARDGEFVAVIGPSGCGKSTALRLLAGLETPDAGEVRLLGRPPADIGAEGRIGVAFQQHALLPWLTVARNIALPFRILGRKVDTRRVHDLIRLVGLSGFEDARPKHLSGGMCQRVSIARSMALDPDVLLLDEPFGALDAVTRRRLNLELQHLWAERGMTTVLVTHSVEEALLLADRVLVMSARPGTIVTQARVPFERPRGGRLEATRDFQALLASLTGALDDEPRSEG